MMPPRRIERMYFVSAFCFISIGLIALSAIRTVARRQSVGTSVCAALWGGWLISIGIFDIGDGFGHPIVQEHTKQTFLLVYVVVCLLSLSLIRRPKQS